MKVLVCKYSQLTMVCHLHINGWRHAFREKEKAETKDHKVLEILQVKDDRIEELHNIVAKQSQEISDLLSKSVVLFPLYQCMSFHVYKRLLEVYTVFHILSSRNRILL